LRQAQLERVGVQVRPEAIHRRQNGRQAEPAIEGDADRLPEHQATPVVSPQARGGSLARSASGARWLASRAAGRGGRRNTRRLPSSVTISRPAPDAHTAVADPTNRRRQKVELRVAGARHRCTRIGPSGHGAEGHAPPHPGSACAASWPRDDRTHVSVVKARHRPGAVKSVRLAAAGGSVGPARPSSRPGMLNP
jgi:hypothetical protein